MGTYPFAKVFQHFTGFLLKKEWKSAEYYPVKYLKATTELPNEDNMLLSDGVECNFIIDVYTLI